MFSDIIEIGLKYYMQEVFHEEKIFDGASC